MYILKVSLSLSTSGICIVTWYPTLAGQCHFSEIAFIFLIFRCHFSSIFNTILCCFNKQKSLKACGYAYPALKIDLITITIIIITGDSFWKRAEWVSVHPKFLEIVFGTFQKLITLKKNPNRTVVRYIGFISKRFIQNRKSLKRSFAFICICHHLLTTLAPSWKIIQIRSWIISYYQ